MLSKFLLTMQYEEDFLLPIFIRHYSKYFPLNCIYVIDHGSKENFVPEGVNRIYVPRRKSFSEADRVTLVSSIINGLLKYYDYGVYADCDELIALEYFNESELASHPVTYICGFDCYTDVLDGQNKILGLINPEMCKPLIFRELPKYMRGFHISSLHAPQLKLSIPMAHVRYLFRSQIAKRVSIRKKVYSTLTSLEKDNGVDAHWLQGDMKLSEFLEHLSLLKKSPIYSFRSFEREAIFYEKTTPSVFIRNSSFLPKADYKLLEERFDLTDTFPELHTCL